MDESVAARRSISRGAAIQTDIGGDMGMLGRFYRAFNAYTGRSKIGALQGGLIFNLKNSGVDSPRSKQFISRIVLAAWNMRVISDFFQSLGFSFDDYETMYHASVIACPNILIQNKDLIATFLMIDNFEKFWIGLHTIAQSMSETSGDERTKGLSTLITLPVNDIIKSNIK
jgi:hypothetical protein